MERFSYPLTLARERKDGGYVATFRDVPEAITQGDDVADALARAEDCIEEAMANRIVTGMEIPRPSKPSRGQHLIQVPAAMAAKLALYLAIREAGISNVALARRLGCDEKEVRRMLDPRHASRLPKIQTALAALGKRLVIDIRAA